MHQFPALGVKTCNAAFVTPYYFAETVHTGPAADLFSPAVAAGDLETGAGENPQVAAQ